MVTGQGYGLGIGGCKRLCRRGHRAWLGYTAFPVWSVKDRSLHKPLRQVTDLLSRAHTWVWALGRLVALLSWIRLFPDRLSWWFVSFGLGGPCTAQSSGLRGEGLESQCGRRPGSRERRVVGWSYLCLGYKRGVCFQGTQLGHWFVNRRAIWYDLFRV